jgi:hypothetical protein
LLQASGSVEKVEKDSSKKDIEKEIAQKVFVSLFFGQNFGICNVWSKFW